MSTKIPEVPESLVPWEPEEPDDGSHATGRSRLVRQLMWLVGIVLVLALIAAGAVFAVSQHFADQVTRVPHVFDTIDPATRPVAGLGQTYLLMGSDSRAPGDTTGSAATSSNFVPGAQRSDVIMLATIARDGSHASVVSIPRDSWVNIPGYGFNKINAAYSFGGPSLLIRTVEDLTRVRVNHFAVIDFAGFAQMTDAAGGIDVNVGTTSERDGVVVPAGPQHLNGAEALVYVRERYALPGGDFDRVQRQQNALRALATGATHSGTLTDPVRAYGLADALTRWVSVDDSMSANDLRGLVWGLRGIKTSNVEFLTAPYTGTGMEGPQSVVYLNQSQGQDLWSAMNNDQVVSYAARYPGGSLPAVPR